MALLLSNFGQDRRHWVVPCLKNHKVIHFADSQLRTIRYKDLQQDEALVLYRGGGFMDLACLLIHHSTFDKRGGCLILFKNAFRKIK